MGWGVFTVMEMVLISNYLNYVKKTKAEYSLFNKQFSDSYSYIGIDYFKLSILFTPLSD